MKNNEQRYVLRFGSTMGFYLSLPQGPSEMACEIVYDSKSDNELWRKSYMLYDALIMIMIYMLWLWCYLLLWCPLLTNHLRYVMLV